MAKKELNILLIMDLGQPAPENQDFREILKEEEDWKPEAQLIRALKNLGHTVKPFGIYDEIHPLYEEITKNRPDLVFNQCEAIRNNRLHEPNVAAFLELMELKYTGAGPAALQICKDKGLTKKILSYEGIRVPQFQISRKSQPIRSLKDCHYPAFIKPLMLEGSEGIAQVSFAENEKDAMERVQFIHESLGTDAIIEEYIEGRELYVGVIGNGRVKVFPPRELFFREVPDGEPKFATYKAKWDDNYRKKWGIKSGPARSLSEKVEKDINEICKEIYRVCHLKGYARIDFRLTPEDEVVFIEANPNPSIARDEDFALSAEKAGLSYEELIEQIINLAFH